MEQNIQLIIDLVNNNLQLSAEEKAAIISKLKETDKKIAITNFKLDRTEKVKRTTAILLKETIEELEQKRKAVEAQNKELEIEAALERVRTVAMSMNKTDDVLSICKIMFTELKSLGFDELRNALINFFDDAHNALLDYDYADFSGGHIAHIPYNSHPTFENFQQRIRSATDAFAELVVGEDELESWKERRRQSGEYEDPRLENITALYYYFYSIGVGAVGISTFSSLTEEKLQLIKRFRNVFDLAYRRYIDIQKAEAQAREAQIEVALERVRARTMAMHKSSELIQTAELLFDQLEQLGAESQGVAFAICDKSSTMVQKWTTIGVFSVPYTIESGEQHMYEAWKNQVGIYEEVYEGEKLRKYYELFMKIPAFKRGIQKFIDEGNPIPIWQKNHAITFQHGYLLLITRKPFKETQIFLRFAKVFEQTYTRFLDLQKAEAQAREAQIETALEKIRSRSLAMHHSDELREVIRIMFEKSSELNVLMGTVAIWLFNKKTKNSVFWVSNNLQYPSLVNLPYDEQLMKEDTNYKDGWQAFLDGKSYINKVYNKSQKDRYFEYVFAHNDLIAIPAEAREFITNGTHYTACLLVEENSSLYFDCWQEESLYSEKSIQILRRFAKVFEQAYVRFLDLQKSEAQVREAQIEAALERVRSASLAMHKADELKNVVAVVFQKLKELGLTFDVAGIQLFTDGTKDIVQWVAAPDLLSAPVRAYLPFVEKDYRESEILKDIWEAKEMGKAFCNKHYSFEEKNKFFEYAGKYNDFIAMPEDIRGFQLAATGYTQTIVPEKRSALWVDSYFGQTIPNEGFDILVRFSRVFEQTYTRFLDLQKAEAQAREAQIQLALERVRARAMAMQNSGELREIAAAVHEQLQGLGFTSGFCSIVIMDRITGDMTWWMFFPGKEYPESYDMHFFEHPFYLAQLNKWKQGEKYSVVEVSGEEKKSYDKHVFSQTEFVKVPVESQQFMMSFEKIIFSNAYMKHGAFSWGVDPIDDEHAAVLQRFANVFEQCYTRFLDLQKAETQAREAKIEAALEKVRSRTMAMQKSNELAETAAVLFQQLIALGINPNRLYIAIVKDALGHSEFWITEEDGTKVSTAFSADLNKNESFIKMFEGWKLQKKSLVLDMQGEELENYFRHLTSLGVPFKGGLQQKRRVQDIAYFSKGFIGMASPEEQPAETLLLLERFAAVFNLTFTRFNDLKIAEAHALQAEQDLIAIKEAKQKAEEALTELQATQKQLIQSEKMASLGELTAGIAHEIQNPLNFVNNFSEVSNELIDEMYDELNKGDIEEAKIIAADLQQNLEKINHHGKRAEAIVKGMLQHSRSSSNVKEPTDINTLADEYLRLAYHGSRAKDKSFNATLNTTYDDGIGMINIIPQDIGRVTLNLITNAFYAVNEKNKNCTDKNYEPTVSINTKKLEDKVLISVTDNGNGIPQKILDKIFQPFFTTKPTGQGTGLGLSLSYDIVKAHGGEIKVESKEGEGTTFIIQLPVS